MTKRALVQSGGGRLGAYSAGVIQALVEKEYRWSIYTGVSVGAMNSALLSMFKPSEAKAAVQRLIYIWLKTTTCDIWKRHFPFGKLHGLWRPSIYNSSPLGALIEKNFNLKKARDSENELYVSATSVSTGEHRIFDLQYDNMAKAIWASAAYPILFSPVTIDGELYVDGGIQRAAPLRSAIAAGAEEIDLILTEPDEPLTLLPAPIRNIFRVAQRVMPITYYAVFETDLALSLAENKLAGIAQQGTEVTINIYRPNRRLGDISDLVKFTPESSNELINQGYADTIDKLSN